MGNSSTKLAEKCSILTKDEVPLVASAFKLVSKNSDRIKEDDLMVSKFRVLKVVQILMTFHVHFRNSGDLNSILDSLSTFRIFCSAGAPPGRRSLSFSDSPSCTCFARAARLTSAFQ